MAQQFAKVAANLDRHPKIREAGRNGREVFSFVLRVNADEGRLGWISARHVRPRYLADTLMMSAEEAAEGLQRAIDAELLTLTPECVSIVGWDEEWAAGPVAGAERTKKWRDKTTGKMPAVTDCDVAAVTVTKCDDANVNRSHGDACDASEKSREEEKRSEKKEKRAGADAPSAAPRPRSRGKVKPSDPSPEEQASAAEVLGKLTERNGVEYRSDAHVRLVAARIRDGVDAFDLRKIVAYCADETGLAWAAKPAMAGYLRPATLFGPQTIHKYLDDARAWYAKNYPEAR
jgi:uncharacterized phage protein (TIGR02220 family)